MTEADRSSTTGEETGSAASLPGLAVGAAVLSSALILVTVIVRSLDPDQFNYDVGWVLHAASRILDGGLIYVDVVDENPPLIFWLSIPPVALARLLGAPPILVFNLAVAFLAFVSGALCLRALRLGWPSAPPAYHLTMAVYVVGLELLTPGTDFGQRENLMVIAVVPYVFAGAVRASGRTLPLRLAISIGVLAGLGLAIKPYFAPMWIAIEATLLVSARLDAGRVSNGGSRSGRAVWLRTESVAIVTIQVAYLLAIALFAPHYREVVAMSLELIAAYREDSLIKLLAPAAVLHVLLAAGAFAMFRPSAIDRDLRRVLLAAAVALLIGAVAQRTDWSYHFLPASVMGLLLLGVIALGPIAHPDALRRILRPGAGMLPLVALLLIAIWSTSQLAMASSRAFGWLEEPRSLTRALSRIVSERAPGEAIWMMSTSVNPAFPVVNLTGARWSSRFCCLWLVAGVYTPEEKAARPFVYHGAEEMTALERLQIDAVIEDLQADPPKLIIVDQSPMKQAFGLSEFQFLGFFRRDERFADFFQQYRQVERIGPIRVYERLPAGE